MNSYLKQSFQHESNKVYEKEYIKDTDIVTLEEDSYDKVIMCRLMWWDDLEMNPERTSNTCSNLENQTGCPTTSELNAIGGNRLCDKDDKERTDTQTLRLFFCHLKIIW